MVKVGQSLFVCRVKEGEEKSTDEIKKRKSVGVGAGRAPPACP